ncbi:Zinc finger CCHC domain-containing protein 3 [Holothuria leucospilota]|uniref:Zinc finger CCHC domain-containing protein 3 n=1 Tax=Holothuria leucospilota TaxID=206669 RepID=A0A9Q1BFV0_HOLLE|nr:Zinc finger CCHC domain-containing protein 3 [Holothuria leucospilota]
MATLNRAASVQVSVKIMRNFFPALLSGCGYTINTYNSSATIVTVLHVPHELEDSVVRYVLGRYGKVICGRYLTFKKYPTVYNGIRQYQMDLKRDIPSSLRLGERSCWVRYEEQPRTCLRCGDESHEVRDCKNIKCLKCHTLGHVAKDCTSEVVCNICEGSGHTYRDCPVSFAHKIQPIPRKWQQTSVGESDIVPTSNATKSSENSQITLKPVEGEVSVTDYTTDGVSGSPKVCKSNDGKDDSHLETTCMEVENPKGLGIDIPSNDYEEASVLQKEKCSLPVKAIDNQEMDENTMEQDLEDSQPWNTDQVNLCSEGSVTDASESLSLLRDDEVMVPLSSDSKEGEASARRFSLGAKSPNDEVRHRRIITQFLLTLSLLSVIPLKKGTGNTTSP